VHNDIFEMRQDVINLAIIG